PPGQAAGAQGNAASGQYSLPAGGAAEAAAQAAPPAALSPQHGQTETLPLQSPPSVLQEGVGQAGRLLALQRLLQPSQVGLECLKAKDGCQCAAGCHDREHVGSGPTNPPAPSLPLCLLPVHEINLDQLLAAACAAVDAQALVGLSYSLWQVWAGRPAPWHSLPPQHCTVYSSPPGSPT
ncbi:hypothetical protein HaLaN_29370, partial [Haematococcus lacustris]